MSEHMAAVNPPNNLRHLLMVRDATDASSTSRPGLTLGSVLGFEKLPVPAAAAPAPSRTLLDIIREEENRPASGGDEGQKITWRSLKDRLLLRRIAGGAAAARPAAEGAGRVSLFSLLEQADRHAVPGEEEEESRSSSSAAGEGGGEYGCCVCMVRHKGAAFIPCGHTFCRVCSRELWVSRGNCPLCNGYILEILDIF